VGDPVENLGLGCRERRMSAQSLQARIEAASKAATTKAARNDPVDIIFRRSFDATAAYFGHERSYG
jgi:hypothetical protein